MKNNLADENLKRVGKKLRFQFDDLKKLNKMITPNEILKQRKNLDICNNQKYLF